MKHYNKIQNKSETKREFIRGRTWDAKQQCKIFRNTGQTYVTESGKLVNA
jgi:hypothetical protein